MSLQIDYMENNLPQVVMLQEEKIASILTRAKFLKILIHYLSTIIEYVCLLLFLDGKNNPIMEEVVYLLFWLNIVVAQNQDDATVHANFPSMFDIEIDTEYEKFRIGTV